MNFASRRRAFHFCVASVALLVVVGCSSRPRNVSKKVTGKVTVGGQPLANALVTFTPADGSPSFGRTDAEGNYSLIWASQGGRPIEGAQIGEHTVMITTFRPGDPSAKPARAETPEKVPYRYREESGVLKVTVKPGANVIDLTMEAGPTEAPQPKGKKGKPKGK